MRKVWLVIGEAMFEGVVPIIGHAHFALLAASRPWSRSRIPSHGQSFCTTSSQTRACQLVDNRIHIQESTSLIYFRCQIKERGDSLPRQYTIELLYWSSATPHMIRVFPTPPLYVSHPHRRPPRPHNNGLSRPLSTTLSITDS